MSKHFSNKVQDILERRSRPSIRILMEEEGDKEEEGGGLFSSFFFLLHFFISLLSISTVCFL